MTRNTFLKQAILAAVAAGLEMPAPSVIIAADPEHVFQCDGRVSNPPRVDNSPHKPT